mgnify:CR=1 FL=1
MDPITRALLLSWEWRLEVIIPVLLLGVLYTAGWRRLRFRRRRRPAQMANGWRLVAYWAGLILIALALLSPIETLSGQLFLMHMIQHLLLVMFAPPLLLLANPLPFILWGLPAPARVQTGKALSHLLHRKSSFRRYLRLATSPGVVWFLFVFFLIGWHDPGLYNAALRSDLVHDIEHLTFFLSAMLYWWHVVGAGPRIHKRFSRPAQVMYVIAAIPPNMFTGVAITFANQPIYTYYLSVPRLWGLDALSDQQLGGLIMWVPGSMMYIIAVLIITARWLQGEEKKPPFPVAQVSTRERMAAPGLKHE